MSHDPIFQHSRKLGRNSNHREEDENCELNKRNRLPNLFQIDEELVQRPNEKKPGNKSATGNRRKVDEAMKSRKKKKKLEEIHSLREYARSLIEEIKSTREKLLLWMVDELNNLESYYDGVTSSVQPVVAATDFTRKKKVNDTHHLGEHLQFKSKSSTKANQPSIADLVAHSLSPIAAVPLALEDNGMLESMIPTSSPSKDFLADGFSDWSIPNPQYLTLPTVRPRTLTRATTCPMSTTWNLQPLILDESKRTLQDARTCLQNNDSLGRRHSSNNVSNAAAYNPTTQSYGGGGGGSIFLCELVGGGGGGGFNSHSNLDQVTSTSAPQFNDEKQRA